MELFSNRTGQNIRPATELNTHRTIKLDARSLIFKIHTDTINKLAKVDRSLRYEIRPLKSLMRKRWRFAPNACWAD
jgi:hypothetical protein